MDKKPETPYPSNSHVAKEQAQPRQREVRQVAKGRVAERKPTFLDKFRKIFFVDDFRDVFFGVITDVIVPGLRDMFYDAITGGASRAVYGDGSPTTRTYRGAKPAGAPTNYSGFSAKPAAAPARGEPDPVRSTYGSMNELIFATREEAVTVKSEFLGTIQEYGIASVHDLYRMAGIDRNWAQDSYGWDVDYLKPEDITITHTREGWILHLPKAIRIQI